MRGSIARAGTALSLLATTALVAPASAAAEPAVPVGTTSVTGSPWHGDGDRWGYDQRVAAGTTIDQVAKVMGVDWMRDQGYTGKGVGIAMIDTGVAKVAGLTGSNVVHGPDLSFESQDPATRYIDRYGHGTHLAGIMVGRNGPNGFKGIAPDAKLTSIKVAAADGAVDVIQVMAAIDWVIQHKNDDPAYPIRVLNLAYGTDGTKDYRTNPLTFAVEQAWKAGIVVVVAGGNDGSSQANLVNPAIDPFVISVGSVDDRGTAPIEDDRLSDFSSRGSSSRRVDFSAPGRSVVSLRAPGSFVDTSYSSARIGSGEFKGSGTSQTSAVVAGAIAGLLQARPSLTPDQVKALCKSATWRMNNQDSAAGAGELVIAWAVTNPMPSNTKQSYTWSTGTGTLESARGNSHVTIDGVALTGEKDIFGNAFSTANWAKASAARTAWQGGKWMGVAFAGDAWVTVNGVKTWSGRAWSGRAWSGGAWNGRAWSGKTWNGKEWSTGG